MTDHQHPYLPPGRFFHKKIPYLSLGNQIQHGTDPVSYTHLDVYKRQGLASINQFLFNHLGANSIWYNITNLLGVIAIIFAVGFAISGLCQFIKGKSISKVDFHLLLLGALYILVIAFYIFFEFVIINYRPVLIDSELEASYPSSHTMITILSLIHI